MVESKRSWSWSLINWEVDFQRNKKLKESRAKFINRRIRESEQKQERGDHEHAGIASAN